MDNTRVFNRDCLPELKEYPDKYFELAIVDPPYGIGKDKINDSLNCKNKAHNWKRHAHKLWDIKPDEYYFSQLNRISVNQIIWGGNYFTPFIPPSMGWIVWDKGQRIDMSDAELAYSSFNRALRVVEYNRAEARQDGIIHPTQKPVALYKWLLKNYAKEGDKILDTHGGSMSSVIACIDMGFSITCFELDEDYYKLAKLRIQNHVSQLNAFRPKYEIEFHDNTGVSVLRDQQ